MQTRRLTILGFAVAALLVVAVPAAAAPTTFSVVSTADTADANLTDGLCRTAGSVCTLRAAIQQANATASGAPYTISLSPIGGQTIDVQTTMPSLTRDLTFVDGCGVGRELDQAMNPTGPPKEPASPPCVGLRSANTVLPGLSVSGADRVYVQGLALTNFTRAVRFLGADNSRVRGSWLGLKVDGTTAESNGVGVQITGRTEDGTPDAATGNFVGGESDATDSSVPACDRSCNVIVNSAGAGIDLAGGPGDPPAGAPLGEKTYIQGNWIGVRNAGGSPAAPNAVGVTVGNAAQTQIGGDDPTGVEGNVIAGNMSGGVDQGTGTQYVGLLHGVFGMSPDGERTVGNGPWNARLRGSAQFGADVDKVLFGPADIGLDLEGPKALVTGSSFFSPDPPSPDAARFKAAAIRLGPGADNAFIGSAAGALAACAPLVDNCNSINDTKPGAPGVWINGADDALIQRNVIGGALFSPPLAGPPVRIDGGATGARIGDDDDNPDARNVLTRTSGPAIELGGGATKVMVGDNEGLALDGTALFTDLTPAPGPGNSGPENDGIQPPAITIATTTGVGGTALPGATVRVLQQQRPAVQGDPNPTPYPTGYTFPTSPSLAVANADGVWGISFSSTLKAGQRFLASQTTEGGSSEFSAPEAASAEHPPPLVTFTAGPPPVVGAAVRSATFSFTSNKAGSTFVCSLDAGTFVPCASPHTVSGIETGGHQLQVKATDPIGKQGPPSSRNWSILFADPAPQPGGPPVAATAAVKFASFVSLPSARGCVSKRSLRITVRTPKGAKVKGVVVRIAGRKVGSAKTARTIPISLKGLKRGRFVVKVEVTLTDGRVIKGSRTYRTCAKKAAKKKRTRR